MLRQSLLKHHYNTTSLTDSKSLCDKFVATVKAANGAGESNLSNYICGAISMWKEDEVIVIKLSFEVC